MTASHLLDANVLIALVISDHEHHDRAAAWVAGTETIALCPIVEGALVRYLIRVGEAPATASAIIAALHDSSRCEFWPDSMSYADIGLGHVTGHRQVTDAYLGALAAQRGGTLATFDRGLSQAFPDHTELIP